MKSRKLIFISKNKILKVKEKVLKQEKVIFSDSICDYCMNNDCRDSVMYENDFDCFLGKKLLEIKK
jgi:hypothetical protein